MDQNQKAFELWKLGKHTEAIEVLFKEIDEQPDRVAGYYNLANMLLVAKKEQDAKAVLDLANEKNPDHPEIVYAFGTYYYQTQDYPQAIHAFAKVAAQDTYLKVDSLIMEAQCYLALGNPKKALAFLLTAEMKKVDDPELLLLIGTTFMQIEGFKEAQNYFKKVTKLAPKNPEAWFKLGLTGMIVNEESSIVETYFEKVRKIDEAYYQKQIKQLGEIQAFIKTNE